jgi:hypothetical protein
MSGLNEFTNLYELSKTLRFELKLEKISEDLKNKTHKKNFSKEDVKNLLDQLKKIEFEVVNLFFYNYSEPESKEIFTEIKFRNRREIKYGWLRNYTKIDFYDWRERRKEQDENTNGLIRQYFPKKTDFTKITQADLDEVVEAINNRPRKTLKYRTPNEVFEEIKLCVSS